MILYRYMGITELMRFLRGDTIKSYYHDRIYFLQEKVKLYQNKDSSNPEIWDVHDCLKFMCESVSHEILCKFEVADDVIEPILSRYVNPYGVNSGRYSNGLYWSGCFCDIIEYWCNNYSDKNFKLLKIEKIEGVGHRHLDTYYILDKYLDTYDKMVKNEELYTDDQINQIRNRIDEMIDDKIQLRKWKCKYNKSMNEIIPLPEVLKR